MVEAVGIPPANLTITFLGVYEIEAGMAVVADVS